MLKALKGPLKRLTPRPSRVVDWLWQRGRSGNGIWLAAAIVVSGLRVLRKLAKPQPQTVFKGELAVGEQLTIRHSQPSNEVE